MKSLICLSILLGVVCGAPERRGMCLSLCGPYGVDCLPGYECRSNGCGHECYRPPNYVAPLGCTPLKCDAHCPLGFKTDDSGCDICQCDYSAFQHNCTASRLCCWLLMHRCQCIPILVIDAANGISKLPVISLLQTLLTAFCGVMCAS